MIGIGMLHSSLKWVLKLDIIEEQDIVKDLLEILTNHRVQKEEYAYAIMRCGQCNALYGDFYVYLAYDDGYVYETQYSCPRCDETKLELVDLGSLEAYVCPRCGEKATLNEGISGFWD